MDVVLIIDSLSEYVSCLQTVQGCAPHWFLHSRVQGTCLVDASVEFEVKNVIQSVLIATSTASYGLSLLTAYTSCTLIMAKCCVQVSLLCHRFLMGTEWDEMGQFTGHIHAPPWCGDLHTGLLICESWFLSGPRQDTYCTTLLSVYPS